MKADKFQRTDLMFRILRPRHGQSADNFRCNLHSDFRCKYSSAETPFKATEMFQYTHFSSCHPFSVKKGFIKGETQRLLRTNSVKKKFESSKRDFKFRLLERGQPQKLVNKIQAEVDFSSRNNALKYKPKTSKNILPFVTILTTKVYRNSN